MFCMPRAESFQLIVLIIRYDLWVWPETANFINLVDEKDTVESDFYYSGRQLAKNRRETEFRSMQESTTTNLTRHRVNSW